MAKDIFEMLIVRCGSNGKGKVVLTNSFPRERDPDTGRLLEVRVCVGGALLRSDGVMLRRNGKPFPDQSQAKDLEPITVAMGDLLCDVPQRNNLPDCFVWKYPNGGRYSG